MIHSHTTPRNGTTHSRLVRPEGSASPGEILQPLLERVSAGLRASTLQEIVDRQLDDLFGGLALLRRGEDFGLELDKDTENDPDRPKDQAPELAIEIPANRYDMLCFEGMMFLQPRVL